MLDTLVLNHKVYLLCMYILHKTESKCSCHKKPHYSTDCYFMTLIISSFHCQPIFCFTDLEEVLFLTNTNAGQALHTGRLAFSL